jgi:hypothetical protein
MKEVWKNIEGYEDTYVVSNYGNIKNLKRGKILKPCDNKSGYLYTTLYKNGKSVKYYIHRLVATAFIPNLQTSPAVNHLDQDRSNNFVENLEWCTYSENVIYSYNQNGRKVYTFTDPFGEIRTIDNLRLFCEENGLDCGHMTHVHDGIRKTHKKWKKH